MARSSQDTLLRDIMSSPVMYVHPDQTGEECMALMTENRLRHWPVMDGDQLIGLVSIGDHTAFGIQGMRASVYERRLL